MPGDPGKSLGGPVRSTSQPRRVASLLAAGATGAAAVLLGLAAPAQATTLNTIWISTDSGAGADQVVSSSYTIPTGYCSVDWDLSGGGGGAGYDGTVPGTNPGAAGGYVEATTPVTAGQTISFVTGAKGADGTAAGHGTGGSGSPAGADGTDQVDSTPATIGGSGGGGGATVVSLAGNSLVAHGGAGGASAAGINGGAGGNGTTNTVSWTGSTGPYTDDAGSNDVGYIDGHVNPCPPAPGAPTGLSATGGNGEATVYFTPDSQTSADSWQYSIGGGTWTDVTPDGSGELSFTLTGLTNGTTYSISVRGVSTVAGAGAASAAVSVTPAVPNGAPTHVVVTPGSSSYVVTWDPPTTSGTFPVAGYVVAYNGGEMGGPLCENVPVTAARRCVGAAVPGTNYSVQVWTVDTKGNWGDQSALVPVGTVAAPVVPSAPPTSTDHLVLPAGTSDTLPAGTTVKLTGHGYLPNSTVSVIIYSSPQVLTSVVTDSTGSFEVTVTVPKGLESGHHTLVASGVDPTGTVRYVTLPVTVTGGTTGSGGLAYTGFDVALPLTGGLIALGVGATLMVVTRRRKVAEPTA